MNRRDLLKNLGTLAASLMLVRCNQGGGGEVASLSAPNGGTNVGGACIPTDSDEAGDFPADGSNLAGDGSTSPLDFVYFGSPIIRTNIADGINGVPLNISLTLQNLSNGCEPLSGHYVYIWHCTPDGQYSAYTGNGNGNHSRSENYLRGIGQTDNLGQINFATVYPGWKTGRAVHVHVQVYRSLSDNGPIHTTQLAFPTTTNEIVQATHGYNGTTGMTANNSDRVFSDGTVTQMLSVFGNVTNGYNASISLRVSA